MNGVGIYVGANVVVMPPHARIQVANAGASAHPGCLPAPGQNHRNKRHNQMTAMTAAATAWPARLNLSFAERAGRTVLTGQRHSGPLLAQKPFYPEPNGCCHIYLIYPPGGIVGGDELSLNAMLGRRACWASRPWSVSLAFGELSRVAEPFFKVEDVAPAHPASAGSATAAGC